MSGREGGGAEEVGGEVNEFSVNKMERVRVQRRK